MGAGAMTSRIGLRISLLSQCNPIPVSPAHGVRRKLAGREAF